MKPKIITFRTTIKKMKLNDHHLPDLTQKMKPKIIIFRITLKR